MYNYRCFKDYVRKGWCSAYTHENAMQSNAVHNMACALGGKKKQKGVGRVRITITGSDGEQPPAHTPCNTRTSQNQKEASKDEIG